MTANTPPPSPVPPSPVTLVPPSTPQEVSKGEARRPLLWSFQGGPGGKSKSPRESFLGSARGYSFDLKRISSRKPPTFVGGSPPPQGAAHQASDRRIKPRMPSGQATKHPCHPPAGRPPPRWPPRPPGRAPRPARACPPSRPVGGTPRIPKGTRPQSIFSFPHSSAIIKKNER